MAEGNTMRQEGESRPTLADRIKELPSKIGRLILLSQRQLAAEGVMDGLAKTPRFEDEDPKTAHRLNLKTRENKNPATTTSPRKDPLTKFLDDKAKYAENSPVAVALPITRPIDLPIPGRTKHDPTVEEARAANAGKSLSKTENAILGFAKKHPVVTVGATLAAIAGGFAAVEAYQENIPGVHREAQPSGFDNSAEKIAINQNNIQFVTLEQIKQQDLKPVINKEAKTIEFILPFKMPENTTGTIERTNLAEINPNAPENLPPIVPIDFKFNNIVKIIAPEKSHMELIRGNQELFGEDPNFPADVRFYKYYPEQDTTVVWWFFDNNPTKQGHFITSLPMQDFKKETGRGTNYEKLPVVDALTEVMTTSEINQPVQLAVMAYKGKIVGPEAEIAGHDFLLKPQFLMVSPNGTGKLLALKKE